MKRKYKSDKVKAHILRGWKITPRIAEDKYNLMRLAPVISRMRKKGYNITTDIIRKKDTSYAEYRLAK